MFKLTQVAIDGPAAAGKSTVAQRVAELLNAVYINTGDMYRALTWQTLRLGISAEHEPDKIRALLHHVRLDCQIDSNGRHQVVINECPVEQATLRKPDVAAVVSFVARIPEVRHWLVQRQRATRKLGTIVMEGRDIGTVVFPSARFKFFLTASPEIRAERRLGQPSEVEVNACVKSVAAEIARRDEIDRTRPFSPLRPASDAIYINTDTLDAEQVCLNIANIIRARENT